MHHRSHKALGILFELLDKMSLPLLNARSETKSVCSAFSSLIYSPGSVRIRALWLARALRRHRWVMSSVSLSLCVLPGEREARKSNRISPQQQHQQAMLSRDCMPLLSHGSEAAQGNLDPLRVMRAWRTLPTGRCRSGRLGSSSVDVERTDKHSRTRSVTAAAL